MKKLELFTLAHPARGPVMGAYDAVEEMQCYWVGADPMLGTPLFALIVSVTQALEDPLVASVKWQAAAEELQEVPLRLAEWEDPTHPVLAIILLYEHAVGHNFVPEIRALDKKTARKTEAQDVEDEFEQLLKKQLTELLADSEVWKSRVLPQPRSSTFNADVSSFILANCQYPAGLLDRTPPGTPPGITSGPADRTWAHLRTLRTASDPKLKLSLDFGLLLGDQIYVDATAGLFDPALTDDRWVRPHLMWLEREAFVLATNGLPLYTLPDDHEFSDNWGPRSPRALSVNPMGARQPAEEAVMALCEGRKAYRAYQCWDRRLPDPPAICPPEASSPPPSPLYRDSMLSNRPFFLADTRTERKPRRIGQGAGDVRKARIMSTAQFKKLQQWIASKTIVDGPRFIASASNVLPRRMVLDDTLPETAVLSDAWDGYPSSLHDLLGAIWASQVSEVVFLTGGEHLALFTSAVISHPDPNEHGPVTVHCVQTPPVYAPFPFANADPRDFRLNDEFQLKHATDSRHRDLRCKVQSEHIKMADGFVHIEVSAPSEDGKSKGANQIKVNFHAAGGQAVSKSIP